MGTLRGAGVQVDTARAGRVVLVLLLVTLVVVGLVLLVAGYRKNSQVDDLRAHGVPVSVTVADCLGLMGGSGSNTAGYECTGTYTVRHTTYTEGIPGSTFYRQGTHVAGVVSSDDPGLLSTPSTVASSHPTVTLYVVGAALLLVAGAIVVWLLLRRRARGHHGLRPVAAWWARARRATVAHGRRPGQALALGAVHPAGPEGRHVRGEGRRVPHDEEGLEEAIARADHKERLIGLIAAPVAGGIGLLVSQSMAAQGTTKAASSTAQVLALSLLVLAAAMLASAWFRKRLYLGIAMCLWGLSIFNLHFWGFGVPYLLFGSWYLVRSYRLQQKLKLVPGRRRHPAPQCRRLRPTGPPEKRYTPPVTGPAKPTKAPKPGTEG